MATQEQLTEAIEIIKISYDWMLTDIKKRADDLNPGNYSAELLQAIAGQDLLREI